MNLSRSLKIGTSGSVWPGEASTFCQPVHTPHTTAYGAVLKPALLDASSPMDQRSSGEATRRMHAFAIPGRNTISENPWRTCRRPCFLSCFGQLVTLSPLIPCFHHYPTTFRKWPFEALTKPPLRRYYSRA